MNDYYPFFGNYKKALIIAPLLVIIDVIGEVLQPQLMSQIVDQGVQHKDLHVVLTTGLLMLGLSFVAIIGNVGNIYYSSRASVGIAAELRLGLFTKIQKFSFSTIATRLICQR